MSGETAVALSPVVELEVKPPTDRYNIVFLTMLTLGIGTLLPWNMFITAVTYFEYKFSREYTGIESTYNANFLAYMGFASQIPNVMFGWLNIYMQLNSDKVVRRVVCSITTEMIVFVLTVLLVVVDTSSWAIVFFWITMLSVVVQSVASGILQNCVYGVAAKLPSKYIGAVVLGSNLSGTFTSLSLIITLTLSPSQTVAAVCYFVTALVVLAVCIKLYLDLPDNTFYRYHMMLHEWDAEHGVGDAEAVVDATERPPYWIIFQRTWPQLANVFLVFFVTLAIFPSVHADIRRSSEEFIVPTKLFAIVLCFLTFNLSALTGNYVAQLVQWPRKEHLIWPVVLRFAFIPLFLMCAYSPQGVTRVMPVYIANDWAYWAIAVAHGFSSGYLSMLGMQYVPKMVPKPYEGIAGMFGAAMLVSGIFCGIIFSMIFPYVVSHIVW